MKKLFTQDELIEMGFRELEGDSLENGGLYRWWRLKKNESHIDITYEYNSNHKVVVICVELNNCELKGRTITLKDVKLLLEVM